MVGNAVLRVAVGRVVAVRMVGVVVARRPRVAADAMLALCRHGAPRLRGPAMRQPATWSCCWSCRASLPQPRRSACLTHARNAWLSRETRRRLSRPETVDLLVLPSPLSRHWHLLRRQRHSIARHRFACCGKRCVSRVVGLPHVASVALRVFPDCLRYRAEASGNQVDVVR